MYLKLIFLILFCSLYFFSNGQTKIYTANKITGNSPIIDGNLIDIAWEKVEWKNNFTQYEPNNGEAPSQQTAFKILYDDDNIYVAIRAYDNEANKIEKKSA